MDNKAAKTTQSMLKSGIVALKCMLICTLTIKLTPSLTGLATSRWMPTCLQHHAK